MAHPRHMFLATAMVALAAFLVTACDEAGIPTPSADTGGSFDAGFTDDTTGGDTGVPDASPVVDTSPSPEVEEFYSELCDECVDRGLICPPPELVIASLQSQQAKMIMPDAADTLCLDPPVDPCEEIREDVESRLWTCEDSTIENAGFSVVDGCELLWIDTTLEFDTQWKHHGPGSLEITVCDPLEEGSRCWVACDGVSID